MIEQAAIGEGDRQHTGRCENDRQGDSRERGQKPTTNRRGTEQINQIAENREKVLTPIAKYNVSAIDPKYAAVKGSRGPETRCLA